MLKPALGPVLTLCLVASSADAQDGRLFAGALAGVATLSADARSEITAAGINVSLYKPENGPALNVLFGVHIHEYVGLQANYVWNRNDLTLVVARDTPTGSAFYEQPASGSQHAIVGDVLLYFRDRASVVRPYLSAGVGAVRLEMNALEGGLAFLATPPRNLSVGRPLLRVAVGLDLVVGREWRIRYSFSESISSNPITAQLTPPGERGLANFQNLFGLVRAF